MEIDLNDIRVSGDASGFDPQIRVLYATAMAKTLNFVLKRDFLNSISVSVPSPDDPGFEYLATEIGNQTPIWLKIEQVGLPVTDTFKVCFDALQKILLFCAHQSQVLFLVTYYKGQYHIYLGIRAVHTGSVGPNRFASYLKDFSQSLWNGLSCSRVAPNNPAYEPVSHILNTGRNFEKVVALTGIPASDVDNDKTYPLSIDYLLKSLRGKNIAYLVCADPIVSDELDSALYEIHELQGQLESVKSMSFQHSEGFTDTHSDCKSWSHTRNEKDFRKLADDILAGLQRTLGYKPATAVAKALKTGGAFAAGAVAGNAIATHAAQTAAGVSTAVTGTAGSGMMIALALAGLASGMFIGSKSDQEGGSETEQHGTSSNDSLSQSIVNKHAESAAKQLEVYARRYETGKATGMWNVGVYLMGDEQAVDNAAQQLMAITSGPASANEPIRKHDITGVVEKMPGFDIVTIPKIYASSHGEVFDHPIGVRNSEIKTILTTKELTAYINFPLRSIDGINAVATTPDFSMRPPKTTGSSSELVIGKLLNGGTSTEMDCVLDLRSLCKHSLVCGINGSGKTNTVLNIVTEVKRQHKPFLIIEPAKSEYVDWAFRYNLGKDKEDQIRILMPGKSSYSAPVGESGERVIVPVEERLRINPFEVLDLGYGNPDDARNKELTHIDLVKNMFGLIFPMHDILPTVLELMIYKLYDCATRFQRVKYPTLSTMLAMCEGDFITNLGYDDKNTKIIRGAMKTRVNSLLHGWKKELLNNPSIQGMTWSELFSKPTVLNLSAVGDDADKSFIMGLLLMFLFEYWQSRAESQDFVFSDNELNHLLIIEEAHRIITANSDSSSPLYKVGRFFTNFLTEMRAYGQGLMVVDQVPGRLVADAVSNTNLKFVHKMVSASDIDSLAAAMGLSAEQKKMIPRLSTGQCIISGVNSVHVSTTSDDDIYWCLMNKMK